MRENSRRRRSSTRRSGSSKTNKILKLVARYHIPLKIFGVLMLLALVFVGRSFFNRMSHPDPRSADAGDVGQVISQLFETRKAGTAAALARYFTADAGDMRPMGDLPAEDVAGMVAKLLANTPAVTRAEPMAIMVSRDRNYAAALVRVVAADTTPATADNATMWALQLRRHDGVFRVSGLSKHTISEFENVKQLVIAVLPTAEHETPYVEVLYAASSAGGSTGMGDAWKIFSSTTAATDEAAETPSERDARFAWLTQQRGQQEPQDDLRIPLLVGTNYAQVPEVLGAPDRVKTTMVTRKKIWTYRDSGKHRLFNRAKVVFDAEAGKLVYFHCYTGTSSRHAVRHTLPSELLASTPVHICVASPQSIYVIWEVNSTQYFAEVARSGSRPLARSMRMINTETGDMKRYRQLDGDAWLAGRVVQFGQWDKREHRVSPMLWFKPVIQFDPAILQAGMANTAL